jgi:hypothetical protein
MSTKMATSLQTPVALLLVLLLAVLVVPVVPVVPVPTQQSLCTLSRALLPLLRLSPGPPSLSKYVDYSWSDA